MKKIAVITLLVFISFKSDISHSAPSDEIEGTKENEIISDMRIDIGTIKFTQAYITETLQRKNKMMNTF